MRPFVWFSLACMIAILLYVSLTPSTMEFFGTDESRDPVVPNKPYPPMIGLVDQLPGQEFFQWKSKSNRVS